MAITLLLHLAPCTLHLAHSLSRPEEAKRAARILDQVHNDRGSDENPDKAIYTGAVLNALGLDNNPTARVFKLFHQRFVLSAYTALLSGPLQVRARWTGMDVSDSTQPECCTLFLITILIISIYISV